MLRDENEDDTCCLCVLADGVSFWKTDQTAQCGRVERRPGGQSLEGKIIVLIEESSRSSEKKTVKCDVMKNPDLIVLIKCIFAEIQIT